MYIHIHMMLQISETNNSTQNTNTHNHGVSRHIALIREGYGVWMVAMFPKCCVVLTC